MEVQRRRRTHGNNAGKQAANRGNHAVYVLPQGLRMLQVGFPGHWGGRDRRRCRDARVHRTARPDVRVWIAARAGNYLHVPASKLHCQELLAMNSSGWTFIRASTGPGAQNPPHTDSNHDRLVRNFGLDLGRWDCHVCLRVVRMRQKFVIFLSSFLTTRRLSCYFGASD